MLTDPKVKWIAIIYEDTVADIDRFHVAPYTDDPTA
jgi:hypothetical protein